MDRFVPRDDAKRQWEQSPERTTPPHPDMQCRVFILRRADSTMPQPQMPASAQAHVGMTWPLDPTTPRYAMSGFYITMDGFMSPVAIDARHRTSQRRHDMATGAIRTLMQYPPNN